MSNNSRLVKPFYKKLWVWVICIIGIFAIASCGDDKTEEVEKKPVVADVSTYTAEQVYNWLQESNLVKESVEDIMEHYSSEEGLVNAIGNEEVSILEYENESFIADSTAPTSLSFRNIWVLIKQGQSQYESFEKVLVAGKPIEVNTLYVSEEQNKVAELMESGADFLPVVEAYYALPTVQKSETWNDFMYGNIITWSGTIADLEVIADSIVVYGGENYNGEDWLTMGLERKDMLPYTFIVELKDESMKNGLKKGDKVTLKASLDSRGDKEMQYNWKLYEGEVVK